MRIFKSTFVKAINKLRGREGVLVKNSFKKQYFETEQEYEDYIAEMEKGLPIKSQSSAYFSRKRIETKISNWRFYRAKKWAEMLMDKQSQNFVACKTIFFTLLHHNPRH